MDAGAIESTVVQAADRQQVDFTTVTMVTDVQPTPPRPRGIELRYLNSNDVDEVRGLCSQIFPVDYPYSWYEDVTSNPYVWSMAATFESHIVGIIVADVKALNQCNAEDRNLLPKWYPANTPVCYMLSLGVDKAWRRRGVASLLLDHLLAYLQTGLVTGGVHVRCLYLHVLVTNEAAIGFYERRHFRRHARLRNYYRIDGESYDGYTYALYINGGQAPWSFSDTISVCGGVILRPWLFLCRMLRGLLHRVTFR